MKVARVQATGKGQVVSYFQFIKHKLTPASIWECLTGFTTVIPNVINDVMDYCKNADPQYSFRVIIPNGVTSASFDILLAGQNFRIQCSRRLVRGWFPLNPFAAEFGSNYDVIFSIVAEGSFESLLLKTLKDKYITFEI